VERRKGSDAACKTDLVRVAFVSRLLLFTGAINRSEYIHRSVVLELFAVRGLVIHFPGSALLSSFFLLKLL
jgi:hypothetical protein